MTKKHFEALAKGLASIRPNESETDSFLTWKSTVHILTAVCKDFNANFDGQRFIGACMK